MYTLKNNLETLSYLQVKVISEQSCSHKKIWREESNLKYGDHLLYARPNKVSYTSQYPQHSVTQVLYTFF